MSVEDQALMRAADPVPGAHGEHGHADEHELPHESLSPIMLAAGVGLLGFGLLTSLVFSVVGLVVMFWAIARWIEEMRHG